MLLRPYFVKIVQRALKENVICALLGPRQCGKTTLALEVAAGRKNVHIFDLESEVGRARLSTPELTLAPLRGLVVIDEIQRQPELFALLRPLADRPDRPARFLILGSASPDLVRGASESLAGRMSFVDLSGFDLRETGADAWGKLWQRGGFPRSFLAANDPASLRWRQNFNRSVIDRNLSQFGVRIHSIALQRFWSILALNHAQWWNAADVARAVGISAQAIKNYLKLLESWYLIRQLPPWIENIGKRQYKSHKIYVRDSGMLHALLSIRNHADLESHPKYGASWEGFAVEQVLSVCGSNDAFCWGTHAGAELDLMLRRGGKNFGIEFKCAGAPAMTKSLHIALEDLKLKQAWIVYPGSEIYPVHEKVTALPITLIERELGRLNT